MFSRLSRARLPLARCIHSRATPPPSRATKYALAVGTFATVAFFGTQTIALDSRPPPRDSSSSLPAGKSPEEFPSFESHLLTSLGRAQVPPESTPEHTDASSTRSEPVSAPADASDASSDSDASESEYSGGGGAYNPETGEINWDCPCLGGMANGPCGPQFREAFSCFVYSEEEPKGINCVEKFQAMQTCFRDHPEVYAAEIADDEEAEAAERAAREAAQPDQKTADVAESAPAESSSPKDASSEQ